MTYLKGIYDSESKRMMIEYKNGLLNNNFEILENCVKEKVSKGLLPKDMEVKNLEDNRCLIVFRMDLPGADKMDNGQRIGKLPQDLTDNISDAIEEFKGKAIEKEFKTTEFIPLTGYPVKELQKDIQEAIKNKRNFCIIDKYTEYLKFSQGLTTKLKQYTVNYLNDDYSNVAIYIYEGNLRKVQDLYKNKLTEVDWG